MARPQRPLEEAAAVRAAANASKRSVSATASDIAKRVVADAMAYLDLDHSDPLIARLAALASLAPDPITTLARCPVIDLVGEIVRERVSRYEARACRQQTPVEREAETREIAVALRKRLAIRYARHLRNSL